MGNGRVTTSRFQPAPNHEAQPSMFQRRPFVPVPSEETEETIDERPQRSLQQPTNTSLVNIPLYAPGQTPAPPIQPQSEENIDLEDEEEPEKETAVKAKLTIGQPGDKYEQEADATAARVMAMPMPIQAARAEEEESDTLQRQPEPDEEDSETVRQLPIGLQRQALSDGEKPNKDKSLTQLKPLVQAKGKGSSAPQGFEQRLSQHKGGGQPLPDETKAFMEPRFGADFSSVRIHEAPKEASDIGAQAFTHGQDIYFNAGKYNPGSSSGKELLAHELTHTIQQTGGKLQQKANKIHLKPNRPVTVDLQARRQPQPDSSTSNEDSSPVTFAPQTDEQTQQQLAPAQPAQPVENQTADSVSSPDKSEGAQPEEAQENRQEEVQETAAETSAPPEVSDAQSKGGGGAGKAASEPQAPTSPDQDPDFQAVVAKSKGIAAQEKQHAPAATESQAAQAAAVSPDSEVESQAQGQQVADMDQQEAGTFDAAAFKQAVMDKVDAAAPKTLEDADKFKDEGLLGKIKDTLSGEAKTAGESAAAPIADKAEQEPDASSITPRESTPLEAPDSGAPPQIDAGAAKPKPKPDSEVSGPMQAESQNLDQQMADAEITEEQLANSNEPQFTGALSAKQDAQAKATEAPQVYRQQEQATLTSAQSEAQTIGQNETQAMHGQREAAMGQLQGLQEGTKSQDEQKRSEVASHIDGIYQETKAAVDGILGGLEGEVMNRFNAGADQARSAYEDYVAPYMEDYKKRYDGLMGAGRWVADKLLGVPEEVTAFFREGRKRYLDKMDAVLTDISTYVTDQLNQAKEKIKEGRQKIQDYVDGLPADLQQVGQEAASNIQSKFDELEQSVDDKHGQLIEALSQTYVKNLEELDARIDEMKASNQPWFAKAFDSLTGVIETINKLKNMLMTVLAKVADTVGNIIKDPIGFLSNLVSGITQGLQNFLGNIWEHLQGGLVGWLTGALGPMGITIPDDIFSLPGIFSLVTQVLGLTWNYIRGKAVKMFGEPVVVAMEQGVEMIQVVKEKGFEGMWEQVKEDFGDLQATVIDQIKDMVITQVITAGIKWIIGLLNPASAFVKACMAIYDIVMFFVNQGSQVLELVNAVVEGVAAIARGAIGGAAKLVESALVKALPVAIGFLASLLGIGGLAKKVQGIIKKIRKRIDKAVNKLLKKAKKLFKKKKGKKNKDKEGSEKEHAKMGDAAANALKQQPSKEMTYEELRNFKKKQAKDLEAKYNKQLEKPVKMIISFKSVGEDKKDGDLDFHIHIGPNDYDKDSSVDPQSDEKVNLTELIEYARKRDISWRKSVDKDLAKAHPESYEDGKLKGGLHRRHILSFEAIARDLVAQLSGLTISKASLRLDGLGYKPKKEDNKSVIEAAKKYLRDKFNDNNNVVPGEGSSNSREGSLISQGYKKINKDDRSSKELKELARQLHEARIDGDPSKLSPEQKELARRQRKLVEKGVDPYSLVK